MKALGTRKPNIHEETQASNRTELRKYISYSESLWKNGVIKIIKVPKGFLSIFTATCTAAAVAVRGYADLDSEGEKDSNRNQ